MNPSRRWHQCFTPLVPARFSALRLCIHLVRAPCSPCGGLGTFGLCDGLITPVGKAIRVGSVVARLEVPAAPRPYQDHQAYCLFFSHGTCLKCVERCPVKAISSEGHDKIRCSQHLGKARNYAGKKYGLENKVGCGLCQVGVPCESHIPTPDEG